MSRPWHASATQNISPAFPRQVSAEATHLNVTEVPKPGQNEQYFVLGVDISVHLAVCFLGPP